MSGCVSRSMNKPEPAVGEHPDMVQTVLQSPLPAAEKTFLRLLSETRSVIMAGTETTASVLVCITACLLKDRNMLAQLRQELATAEAESGFPLNYTKLKELPFLTGVVNEGLRVANPTPSRLPRVCEIQDLKYKEWIIPRGVSSNPSLTHPSQADSDTPPRQAFQQHAKMCTLILPSLSVLSISFLVGGKPPRSAKLSTNI